MKPAKISLFFCFFFLSAQLIAQTNFLPGFYVKADRDTVHGYIEHRSETRNQRVCVFKAELGSTSVTFSPEDILGYAIQDGPLYEKHAFQTRQGEKIEVFFKVLVRGRLSLLAYGDQYFAENSDSAMFDITKRQEVVSVPSGSELNSLRMRVDYYGLGILKVLMTDCKEISSAMLEREYKGDPDFRRLFVNYNKCIGSGVIEPRINMQGPHLDFGLQASGAMNKLSLSHPLENAAFGNNFNYEVGVFASTFIPKVSEHVRFVVEATYGRCKWYSYFSANNENNDLFVGYTFLKVPVILRFSQDWFLFDIGLQSQSILNQHMTWRIETVQQNTVLTSDGQPPPLPKWSYGYLVGIGTKFKLSGHDLRSSIRFSKRQKNNLNNAVLQSIELLVSFQLTK